MSDAPSPPPPPPSRKTGRIDGRRLRSERTKQLIVEAYLALLRDGNRNPTAAQTAERAGYSVRSVFERFPDLHALRVMATDYSMSQSAALAPARHVDGDRPTRIRSQVETRAGTCERGLLLWRMLMVFQQDSPELKKREVLGRERTMGRMEQMYAPELAPLDAAARKHLLVALEALTDFESWARMREFHGLSVEEACALWIRAIDRLLPATPPRGP
ncbi:MAG: TetR/AcrR family transcriptional regulator [Proteobacteria bacterium]|nr:TetR/AcrR family transcriptional regulator [Pseudomonadota bacterium]